MASSKSWRKSESFTDSFRHAAHGVRLAIKRDKNIRRQLVLVALVCIFSFIFAIPFLQVGIVLLACGLVLGLEMINSALEAAEDVLHPKYHDMIGVSKDIAAGAVLVVSIAAVLVGLFVFGPVFWQLAS